MDNSKIGPSRVISTLSPLCMTVAATAIVIQDAYAARAAASSFDEPLQPLSHWLSPAALVFLAGGYVLSAMVIWYGLRKDKGSGK